MQSLKKKVISSIGWMVLGCMTLLGDVFIGKEHNSFAMEEKIPKPFKVIDAAEPTEWGPFVKNRELNISDDPNQGLNEEELKKIFSGQLIKRETPRVDEQNIPTFSHMKFFAGLPSSKIEFLAAYFSHLESHSGYVPHMKEIKRIEGPENMFEYTVQIPYSQEDFYSVRLNAFRPHDQFISIYLSLCDDKENNSLKSMNNHALFSQVAQGVIFSYDIDIIPILKDETARGLAKTVFPATMERTFKSYVGRFHGLAPFVNQTEVISNFHSILLKRVELFKESLDQAL